MRNRTSIDLSRRFVMKSALALATGLGFPQGLFGALLAEKSVEKTLSLYSVNTGERLTATYWCDGVWVPQGLDAVNRLMRDYRSGDIAAIDPYLLDRVYALHQLFGGRGDVHIVSGYRSDATNAARHRHSRGVAKESFHTKGMAVDFYLEHVGVQALREAALAQKGGGVGYYPRSGFIHIDTGPIRQWRGV